MVLVIELLIMLLLAIMIVALEAHVIAIHDDDWTSTVADISEADFIDGEHVVQTRDSQVPILRGINGVIGAATAVNSQVYEETGHPRLTLMPSTWKETQKIFWENYINTTPIQDGTTATDFNSAIVAPIKMPWWTKGMNIQLQENMNWLNTGDSQIIGFNATAQNITTLLSYQYGTPVPWNGDLWPLVVVRKTATDDVTADVWSSVANELFTDDGIDPDAQYRPLWGYAYAEGALNVTTLAWRMSTVDHKIWIGGIGNGSNFGAHIVTWFEDDSIIVNGDTNFRYEALGDAAQKPTVVVAFQEVAKGAEPTTVSTRSTPTRARGPSRVSGRKPGGRFSLSRRT